MSMMVNVLNPSLALLTDLYQLTMAYGYWKSGLADREAVFHLSFRKPPFAGGYAIAAGLASVIEYVKKLQFGDGDLAFLAQLQGNDGKPLFDRAFLVYMRRLRFNLDIDAVPEGTVVFANEPLVRVKGPLLQCQIVESAMLNMINFQTLIATKSARICQAAKGEPVLEFGLRRAQGVDGAISGSRAAFIGGAAATSNVLAGKIFGIPVKGTHAHSWVMSFDSEPDAFDAYAKALPNNCIFLVDTYDTLEGVRNAIAQGKKLRERGYELAGIRLDSGDLAYLSIEARKLLDAEGFTQTKILASNDLDEHLIADLKQQGAAIDTWGVGTKLVTAFDEPALGGVYKLSALHDAEKKWRHKIKRSEQTAKVSIPGILQVRRYRTESGFVADAIYDTLTGIEDTCTIVDPLDVTRRKTVDAGTAHEDLLVPIFREGKAVYDQPPLVQIRQRTSEQLAMLHPSIRRFANPHRYPAGLEQKLFELRNNLIVGAQPAAHSAKPTAQPWASERDDVPTEAPSPGPAPAAQPVPETKTQPEPQRPKFAGIGSKFGQSPRPGSNVQVNVNRPHRGNPLFPRGK
jgi:nicotinate phosphoribosyltransferase